MSTTTENYNLIIPEGDDLFAPLNVEAPNFRSIDSNMWDNHLAGIQAATELISGSVHAITRETPDAPMFRYTATGAFNNGDTFTVDGIAVQAVLPNGMAIEGGAYIEGCEVLAAVVGSKMTLYIGAGSGDADTLEGHPANYFGTAQRTEEVAALAQAANTTANAANSAAQEAADVAAQALAASGMKFVEVWRNPDLTNTFADNSYATMTNIPGGVKMYIVACTYSIYKESPSIFGGNSWSFSTVLPLANSAANTAMIISWNGGSMDNDQESRRTVYIDGNKMYFPKSTSTAQCVPFAIYAVA